VAGALLVGVLALATELGLGRLQRMVVSEGLRAGQARVDEALAPA
jgi:hypothetical protein